MRTLALVLLLLLPLLACNDGVDHYARAVAVERDLLRSDTTAGYEHERYVLVLRELNAVRLRDDRRPQADAMARRIMDGRRIALAEAMPEAGRLPARLRDRPPAPPPRQAPSAEHAAPRVPREQAPAVALTDSARSKLDITLYSTAWCGYCKKARRWFQSEGIPFVEKDIEKDAAAAAEYRGKSNGYSGVPLIDVNGTTVRGFDQGRIQSLVSAVIAR